MKCKKCKNQAEVNFSHLEPLCEKHFLETIEKRVRKNLRKKSLICKGDRILIIDNNSKEYAVGEFLLKNIIKDLPVKIETKKSEKLSYASSNHNKIIVPWSLDDETEEFLNFMFSKKKTKKFGKKYHKLLKNISEEEIEKFAEIKRFKYKHKKRSRIKEMLDTLEKRYPGYKFSLLNSIKEVKSLK